jgi:hypothetical protein
MKIVWKSGSQFKLDAETAYREVERVRAKHGGEATAETVLQAASSKRNPLHGEFEWDDPTAAHEYRLEQARRLLRSIEVIREDVKTDRPSRVYEVVTVRNDDGGKARKIYQSVDEIMTDPDTRAELLSRALRELVAWQRRYRNLQELAIVFRAAEEVLETVEV